MSDLAVEYVDVDELVPDERNPKSHDLDELGGSVDELGWIEPVVIDGRTGKLVSGHGRRDLVLRRRAQSEDGDADPPPGVRIEDGRWLVPVVVGWESRDDDHAEKALVALNRIGERGGWNDEALAGSLQRIREATGLFGTGFEPDDVDDLMARVLGRDNEPEQEPPPPPPDPISETGDLWCIGRHRILCGDAFDEAVLERLYRPQEIGCLLTDPPYGIGLDTDFSKMGRGKPGSLLHGTQPNTYRPVAGDDEPFDASTLRAFFTDIEEQFWFGANYYRRTLSDSDLDGSWLVWDKRLTEESDRMFGSGFELIWSSTAHKQDLLRHYFAGAFGVEARNRQHPTQKPTPMLAEILDRWTPDGCIVADPFIGSGSTLIAAHRTGRIGYGIELEPAYVDVSVARLSTDTGHQAVHAETGEPFPLG